MPEICSFGIDVRQIVSERQRMNEREAAPAGRCCWLLLFIFDAN